MKCHKIVCNTCHIIAEAVGKLSSAGVWKGAGKGWVRKGYLRSVFQTQLPDLCPHLTEKHWSIEKHIRSFFFVFQQTKFLLLNYVSSLLPLSPEPPPDFWVFPNYPKPKENKFQNHFYLHLAVEYQSSCFIQMAFSSSWLFLNLLFMLKICAWPQFGFNFFWSVAMTILLQVPGWFLCAARVEKLYTKPALKKVDLTIIGACVPFILIPRIRL